MTHYQRLLEIFLPCRKLDAGILRLRQLAKEYETENRAYYGEYLSSFLFD